MSKLQRLRDNIAALREAFSENSPKNMEALAKYSGFGGMNFILNPKDPKCWSKSDMVYFEDTMNLHEILRENSKNGNELAMWMNSLNSSVLTAYYTPMEFVMALTEVIYGLPTPNGTDTYLTPKMMLDPAAGMGAFMDAVSDSAVGNWYKVSMTAFEKDILTATMLKAKMNAKFVPNNGRAFVYCDGFEKYPDDELGRFDLVATNVPFGDIKVFDAAYSNSKEAVRREAARYIHRYYVLKGLDCLRDGGIEAYIITSNYLNRDGEQLAEALKQSRLIGAYRLANNLFKEAGTEVGTDLLVLQKDSKKEGLTADDSFLLTMYEDGGCPTNMYFDMKPDHVIATDTERGTDAYGKPGLVYWHKDGVQGIAKDMAKVLSADLAENLSVELFELGGKTAEHGTEKPAKSKKPTKKQRPAKAPRKERMMKAILKCYTMLYDYEATEMQENSIWRQRLNRLHDAFVKEFGPLNYAPNRGAAKEVSKELMALEYRSTENGVWTKADIFDHPVAFSTGEPASAVVTAQDALARSLNRWGRVEVPEMCAMTGMNEDELLQELDGEVFWNPLSGEFEIKARFVSGNVVEKLERMKAGWPKVARYLDGETDEHSGLPTLEVPEEMRILQSMRALQDAIPAEIPFADLDFNLGERWIDSKVYGDFGSEFFSMPEDSTKSSYWSGKVQVTVKYNDERIRN